MLLMCIRLPLTDKLDDALVSTALLNYNSLVMATTNRQNM